MNHDCDNNGKRARTERELFLIRVFFANIGGLLALVGVLVSAGVFIGKMDSLQVTAATNTVKLTTVVTDVAVIKSSLSDQRERIKELELRLNGKH